ncbi:MAG: hypothetical protein LBR21_04945 [Propionibacteriaceae bacterium]|jgi:uncharacterized protein YukE|nr:hypothetical protein [Propionibacteriaceae bacterium]
MADVQVYKHAGIEAEVVKDLQDTVNSFASRIERFAEDVNKQVPEWEGGTKEAFETARAEWTKQIQALHQWAAQLPGVVSGINESASNLDRQMASRF